MALLDNGFKWGTGLAIGVGVLILAPVAVPAVAAIMRPIAKATIKSGLLLVEKTKELMAEAKETIEDMTAEVQAEMANERQSIEEPPAAVEQT